MSIVKFETIENKLIKYNNQLVIVDSDVAQLYGVETRDINKAVRNNPDKFPDGYVITLTKDELKTLQWKFSTAKFNMTRVPPKVFTVKRSLYVGYHYQK